MSLFKDQEWVYWAEKRETEQDVSAEVNFKCKLIK